MQAPWHHIETKPPWHTFSQDGWQECVWTVDKTWYIQRDHGDRLMLHYEGMLSKNNNVMVVRIVSRRFSNAISSDQEVVFAYLGTRCRQYIICYWHSTRELQFFRSRFFPSQDRFILTFILHCPTSTNDHADSSPTLEPRLHTSLIELPQAGSRQRFRIIYSSCCCFAADPFLHTHSRRYILKGGDRVRRCHGDTKTILVIVSVCLYIKRQRIASCWEPSLSLPVRSKVYDDSSLVLLVTKLCIHMEKNHPHILRVKLPLYKIVGYTMRAEYTMRAKKSKINSYRRIRYVHW